MIFGRKLVIFGVNSFWKAYFISLQIILGGGFWKNLHPWQTYWLVTNRKSWTQTTQRYLRIRDRKLLQKKLNTDLNMSDLFLQGYICIFKNNPQIWFLMLWKKWLQSLVDIIFTKKFIYKFSLKHQLFFPFQRIKSWSTIDLFLIYRWSTMYISTLGGQSTFRPLVDNRHFYSW